MPPVDLVRGAAVNMKKMAMELGGKSPNIVFADADFETAVDNALTAAFTHSGQVCSAGCRAIVQDTIYDRFVDEIGRRADAGSAWATAATTRPRPARSSAPPTADKVEAFVAEALAEGARLVAGGRRPDEPDLQDGFFYRPTVFADVRRDMRIIREEVFGPVLTVERFSTEDEAIALGNDTTYGLAGAVWTGDAARAQRVAARLRHGTVWINDYNTYLPQAEWGGFKQSRDRAGTWPELASTSTVRRSTSGRTRRRGHRAGSEGEDQRDGDERRDPTTETAAPATPTLVGPQPLEGLRPGRAQDHRARRTRTCRATNCRRKTGSTIGLRDVSLRRLARRGLRRHGPVG